MAASNSLENNRTPLSATQTAARQIWETVFGDEDAYISHYFSTFFSPATLRLVGDYTKGLKALSHLQFPAYLLRWDGVLCPAHYVVAIATLPSHRGKGYAMRLLRSAFTDMHRRGVFFSFLIPAEASLYDYYRSQAQYAAVGRRYRQAACPMKALSPIYETKATPALYHAFVRTRRSWPFLHIAHSFGSFRAATIEAGLFGGGLTEEAAQLGWIRPIGGGFVEQVITTRSDSPIAQHIAAITPYPTGGSKEERHGMLRLVDIPRIMALWAKKHPQKAIQFDLHDPLLLPNNGRYKVSKGYLTFQPLPAKALTPRALTPDMLAETLLPTLYLDLLLD